MRVINIGLAWRPSAWIFGWWPDAWCNDEQWFGLGPIAFLIERRAA